MLLSLRGFFIGIIERDNRLGRDQIYCDYTDKYYYYGSNYEKASIIHPIVCYK
jgi:hypothetical protein